MLSPHEIREVCQAGKDRDPGWYRIHRRLSIHVTARLLQTQITLGHVSALMLSLGVAGAVLNASPHLLVNALGWACLYGAFLLDKIDGEIARFRRQESVIGILLDRFHHRMVEPLLFLALGWRAFGATHSLLPLIAALAAMLAANIVEETQHLPAYIAAKFAREKRAWPVSGRAPSAGWERVAPWMRSLKTFRTFITVLPLAAAAELLEALTRQPVTTWLLVTSAVALWVYALFQAGYYVAGRLELEIDEHIRQLPALPEPGNAPVEAAAANELPAVPQAIIEPIVVHDGTSARTGTAWPLPRRRRSVTVALEHADAERDRPRTHAEPEFPEVESPAPNGAPDRKPGPGPLAVVLLLALLAGKASAGTYYVDGSSPQCSSAGPGTPDQPYCTISAAIAARGTAGNTILVQPGIYRETITFPASGTSLAPIVLRANGAGVIIDGADDLSAPGQWVQFSGNVWLAAGVNWSPGQVFADGARLTAASNPPNSLPSGTFRFVPNDGLYVNAGGGNPGLHNVQASRRANAFVISNKSWITIQGFTVTRTDERSFNIKSGASDLAILDCTVTFSNRYGIYLNNCARVRIAGNVVTDSNNHGIILTAGSTGCVIEDNEGARNAVPGARSANGLYLYGSSSNTIRRNRWHHNQDTGQHLQSASNNNLSYNNVSWSNGDHGFDHVGASGTHHLNDVAYGNFKDGFSIEGTSPNTQLANCIAVNNGVTTGEFDLWVDPTSTSGFVSNDNIFWNSTSQSPFKYIGTLYSTLAAYQAASGQDSRSLQADPGFVNPAAGDLHLLAGSPAIDSGNSLSLEWSATDAGGSARFDDPATANTGLGPIAWSDRGAFEYRAGGAPPVAVLAANPPLATAPALVTLDASGSSDPDNDPLSYRFDFGDGTSEGPQPFPSATHIYAAGTYTATVTVTDGSGLSDSASTPVISNHRPLASLAGSPVVGRAPLSVGLDASGSSDADGLVVSYTFDFGDGTVVGPQPAATAAHLYTTGQWQATVTVTDDRGAVSLASAPLAVSVAPPNQPPVVVAPALVTVTEGDTVSVPVTVTDADGDPILDLLPNLASLPSGDDAVFTPVADLSGGQLVWHTTYADSGTYLVTFVADNDLSDTASTVIHVVNADRAPLVTAPAPAFELGEGVPFSLGVTAVDPDGDAVATLVANVSPAPAGAAPVFTPAPGAGSGTLAWTPSFVDSGTYTVTFTAANALQGSSTVTLHVGNVDRAPVVTAPATAHVAIGSPIALNVGASDPDGDPIDSLTASLAGLPAGHTATFTAAADARSGVLAWTPAPGDTGHYTLVFTAANALGGSATTVLAVTPPNLAPTAALSATPRTGNAPLNVSANASASSDPDGGSLSYRFEFGDGVVLGPQASPLASHKYAAGTWTLLVSVTDPDGGASSASTVLTVAPTGPGLNLVLNPSFESNTTGWGRYGASSFARAGGGFDRNFCLRVRGPANLGPFGIDDSTNWVASVPTSGTRWRFTAWVRAGSSRGSARLRVRELSGGTPLGDVVVSAPVPLTATWQPLKAEIVATASGSTLDFQIVDEPLAAGEVFDVDNVAIHIIPATASSTPVTTSETPTETPDSRGQMGGAPPGAGPDVPATTAPAPAPASAAAAPAPSARFAVWIEPGRPAPGATLSFTTTVPGPVRIDLFDLAGRRVRRALDEPSVAPGLHNVTLDGRGDQGERLGSGVYFYRVQAIERVVSGRFLLVR